jgi:hypothetical protein
MYLSDCVKAKSTLKVRLRDVQSVSPETVGEPMELSAVNMSTNETETVTLRSTDDLASNDAETSVLQSSNDFANENPFTLTDEEVAHILEGLEQTFTPNEIDNLLWGNEDIPDEETLNANSYIDVEVKRMMAMDAEDFVV